jgi:hypothetical protein
MLLSFLCRDNILSFGLFSVSAQTLPVNQAVLVFLVFTVCYVDNASATTSYGKTN